MPKVLALPTLVDDVLLHIVVLPTAAVVQYDITSGIAHHSRIVETEAASHTVYHDHIKVAGCMIKYLAGITSKSMVIHTVIFSFGSIVRMLG